MQRHFNLAVPVIAMPEAHRHGPGRDLRFSLPQYFVDIDGQRTAFFDAGEGPAVIFIHGLAGNLTHWLHIAPHFAARYRVLGLDLPGCGESARAPRYDVHTYSARVLAFMDALGITSATLVGHSLGGMVVAACALNCATSAPSRVERAVLIDPAGFRALPPLARVVGERLLEERVLNALLPRVWTRLLRQVFTTDNENTRAFMQNVAETYRVSDVAAVAEVMGALRRDFLRRDLSADLAKISIPVHFIWGEGDRLVPAASLKRAAGRLKNVTAMEIARCGHMPIIEKPERVREALEAFFAAERLAA